MVRKHYQTDDALEDSRDELIVDVESTVKNLANEIQILKSNETTLAATALMQKKVVDALKIREEDLTKKVDAQLAVMNAHQKDRVAQHVTMCGVTESQRTETDHLRTMVNREKAFNTGVFTALKERLAKLEKKALPKLLRCAVSKRGPWMIVLHDPKTDGYLPKGMVQVFKGADSEDVTIEGKQVTTQVSELVFENSLEAYTEPRRLKSWLLLTTINLALGAGLSELIQLAL